MRVIQQISSLSRVLNSAEMTQRCIKLNMDLWMSNVGITQTLQDQGKVRGIAKKQ